MATPPPWGHIYILTAKLGIFCLKRKLLGKYCA